MAMVLDQTPISCVANDDRCPPNDAYIELEELVDPQVEVTRTMSIRGTLVGRFFHCHSHLFLTPGEDEIEVVAEPNNAHDVNARAVYLVKKRGTKARDSSDKLGYVNRSCAAELAGGVTKRARLRGSGLGPIPIEVEVEHRHLS